MHVKKRQRIEKNLVIFIFTLQKSRMYVRYTYMDTLSKKLSQTSMHTTNKVVLSNFFENSVMAWIMFLKETHFGLKRISEIVLCSDFTECWLSKNYVVTPSNWICLRTWYNTNDYKITKILACIYIWCVVRKDFTELLSSS